MSSHMNVKIKFERFPGMRFNASIRLYPNFIPKKKQMMKLV